MRYIKDAALCKIYRKKRGVENHLDFATFLRKGIFRKNRTSQKTNNIGKEKYEKASYRINLPNTFKRGERFDYDKNM